jgi:hypothetical protein
MKKEGLILSKWDNKPFGEFREKRACLWHMDLNSPQTAMKISAS